MSKQALTFSEVSKRYSRRSPLALDAFDCRVPTGSLCGLIGPNGAGKTTAFSIVCGFLSPDAGEVSLLGEGPFDPWRCKGRLGVLPQDAELGVRHTPRELLTHLARLQGLSRADARQEAQKKLDLVRLADRRDKRIGSLSHGMRRRVAVASALVGDPALVLLDEPTAGLDPVQARSLRQALLERPSGQTIVVSSHNLNELEQICDWVVMMDKGRCIRQGTVSEVTGQGELVIWRLGAGEIPIDTLREKLPTCELRIAGRELLQSAPPSGDLDAASIVVAAVLSQAQIPIREVQRGVSLERRFFDDAGET